MSPTYCTQADIELEYGATNLAQWADIDNDGDATKKANRIAHAIAVASEEIEEVLRKMHFRLPAVQGSGSGIPTTINRLAAVMAGLWLYECRGAQDFSRDGTPLHGHWWRRQWADKYLEELRTGVRKLDAIEGYP